jgi:RNA-directed DNA polymerase
VNTGEPLTWPDPFSAEQRVRRMQAKLHHWAVRDASRRFDDLFNLVCHPDFLTVAWERVRGNKGARTAGVDRVIPRFISEGADIVAFLSDVREQLKSGAFAPLPVRERLIPKAGQPGKFRRLGIPTAMDRLVQASLVLVLEPIFEADFKPVSNGFRPGGAPRTQSPRSITSAPGDLTGCSRPTSRRASTSCHTARSWIGYGGGSGTSASWR